MATSGQAHVTYSTWYDEETTLYLHLKENAKVIATTWADEDVLKEMEIHNQVKYLISKMDMGNILAMDYPTYRDPTLQFLSTVSMVQGRGPNESSAYLTFRIKEDFYKVPLEEICQVYGFNQEKEEFGYGYEIESRILWKRVAFGEFEEISAKLSKVRNPTIRYLLGLLGNTFVGRSSPKLVSQLSLKLLFRSLKTVMRGPSGELMGDLEEDNVNNGGVFLCEMLDYNEELRTTEKPLIRIGGLLTPLFLHVGVNLGEFRKLRGERKMDMKHLVKEKFLYGYHGYINIQVTYLFIDEERQRRACYLPLQEHTTATKDENLSFHLPQHLLVNPYTLPSQPRLHKSHPDTPQPTKDDEYAFGFDYQREEPPQDYQRSEYEEYLEKRVNDQEKVIKKQGNFLTKLWRKMKRSDKYNRYATSSEEEVEDEITSGHDLERPRHSMAHPPLVIREQEEQRMQPPRTSFQEPPRRRHGKDPVGPSSRPRRSNRNNESDSSVGSTRHSYI